MMTVLAMAIIMMMIGYHANDCDGVYDGCGWMVPKVIELIVMLVIVMVMTMMMMLGMVDDGKGDLGCSSDSDFFGIMLLLVMMVMLHHYCCS